MNKVKKAVKNRTHITGMVVVVFFCICLIMGILCFQYYHKLQKTVAEESSSYLQEISFHIGSNVSKTINDNFSVLGTIATVLKNSNVTSYEQLQPIVREQQEYWNFQNIMLVDKDGNAYDAYGKNVSVGGQDYLRDVIINNKRAMSAAQLFNGKECIVFAIPIQGVTLDKKEMYVLAATYDLSTFDQSLAMNAFSGRGYAHIIQRDGTVVIRSSSEYAMDFGYNILNTLSNATLGGKFGWQRLRTEIVDGRKGQVEFTMNGEREYMVYLPLDTSEWSLLTFVPVSVVNAKSELLLKLTILICGVITVAFALLFVFLFLSFYRYKHKLEQIAYVDPVTSGNTIQRFYEMAQYTLDNSGKVAYALVYSNIEKFKVLNEQFGRSACDGVLRGLEDGIQRDLTEKECIGRLFADNFCILVQFENEQKMMERFRKWYDNASSYIEQNDKVWLPLIVEFGVYIIDNATMPFANMIDRAKLGLKESMRELHGKLRYAVYDEKIRRQLFREKQLEDMMENSLNEGEFQVYLQPKYEVNSEGIGGAEALVRWKSKMEGMIYPDEFISLFEKNGFIVQVDLWVFEEVCRVMRTWLDSGLNPVRISINCSRVQLKNPDFLMKYAQIADQYNIPEGLLEIELTENVVFEDVSRLKNIIADIHSIGFKCSMDDFGSGYSSLNLIQDIPVDTLKLDKIFFRNGTANLERTKSVVGSIITMARALRMTTVAEGVEEREQVDMLKELDCDYIQGFYFAKPMPIRDFEKLLFGHPVQE